MRRTYHIRLHDLLTMRCVDHVGLTDRLFMRPMRGYVHHRVASLGDDPDIEIEIGPFDFERRQYTLVDRRFRIDDNYFACEDTYKILWWKVEIDGFSEGRSRMRIDANAFGTAAIGSRLIDCLVRFHLARRGAPAVHASGVVTPEGAYLLSGRSGVGKSTLAMKLMARGFKLLGDNWVLVDRGQARCLQLPINVHDYNVPQSVYQRMGHRSQRILQLYTWARRLSGGFLKKATPLILADVFPDAVAEQAPVRQILTFRQGQAWHIGPLSRDRALRRLVANDMMDREAFYRYQSAYAVVFPDSPVAMHWFRLGKRLDAAIPKSTDFFDVVVPPRITDAEIRVLLETFSCSAVKIANSGMVSAA